MLIVSCSKDADEVRQEPVPAPVPEEPLREEAEFSLNLGVGSHNLMWTVESGSRAVTRADVPGKLELRGDLYFYAYADDEEPASGYVPSIKGGVTISNYAEQYVVKTLTTNFSAANNSGDFFCRKYNELMTEAHKAVYAPNHQQRYHFFTYNVDNSYTTFDGQNCSSIYSAVSLANIDRYIGEGEPLQWNNLPKLSPFCAWMHSDVARTRENGDVQSNNGTYYDGNLILLPGYDMEGKPRYEVYIPFIMHPAMALLRLNYKLSYAYAMQSGGAAHDDEGFREFRIKSVVLNKFPNDETNVSIDIKKAAEDKPYASLKSDVTDGTFTEVATIYAAPTTATLTVPMTITYDVFDRTGNLLRKNQTVDGSFLITQRLEGGKYYDVNLSIVPSFLYTMSDIDPDSPNGYIIEK